MRTLAAPALYRRWRAAGSRVIVGFERRADGAVASDRPILKETLSNAWDPALRRWEPSLDATLVCTALLGRASC